MIEQTFGILKARWRILKYVNVNSVERAVEIITVGCILHNFCMLNQDDFITEEDDEEQPLSENICQVQHADEVAKAKRNLICNLLES